MIDPSRDVHEGADRGVSESLAGRVAVVTLLPFSVGEAAGVGGESPPPATLLSRIRAGTVKTAAPGFDMADWLLRGAYPEVRANPEVDRDLWCAGYVQTYLERDVRQVVNVGDLNAFQSRGQATQPRNSACLLAETDMEVLRYHGA